MFNTTSGQHIPMFQSFVTITPYKRVISKVLRNTDALLFSPEPGDTVKLAFKLTIDMSVQ